MLERLILPLAVSEDTGKLTDCQALLVTSIPVTWSSPELSAGVVSILTRKPPERLLLPALIIFRSNSRLPWA